ncbi:MAG: hypothetical protein IT435_15235 [Phycisphaerales bacterium]|nr:hypothetical protein [Phycisphaerales bacterium]
MLLGNPAGYLSGKHGVPDSPVYRSDMPAYSAAAMTISLPALVTLGLATAGFQPVPAASSRSDGITPVSIHTGPTRGYVVARYASPAGAGECEIGCDFESAAWFWITADQVLGTTCDGVSFAGEAAEGGLKPVDMPLIQAEGLGEVITGLIGREIASRHARQIAGQPGTYITISVALPAGMMFRGTAPSLDSDRRFLFTIDERGRILEAWPEDSPNDLRRSYEYSELLIRPIFV